MIRILIIENETLVRVGIRTVLLAETDVEIVGEAETSEAGLNLLTEKKPAVILMSLRLKETCAIDDVKVFREVDPNVRIIILASRAGDGEISKALDQGASGYLLKDVSPEELIKAIRTVAAGKGYLPTEVAQVLSEHRGHETLTPTELIVLRLVVGAMSNNEIAFALEVSENTIKTHVKNIFDKLGVSDRTSATTTAIRRGLVRMDV